MKDLKTAYKMTNNISKILDEQGKKQNWLADSLGVSEQTISNISNEHHNPSLLGAFIITKLLGKKHIDQVFTLEEIKQEGKQDTNQE